MIENENLLKVFNKFKNENNTISYVDIKRIMNIFSFDINKIEYQNSYTYDEFCDQVIKLIPTYEKDLVITKKNFSSKLSEHFDKDNINYITQKVFNDKTKLKLFEIDFEE